MHKQVHLETEHTPDGRNRNQIDHCLIDGRHFSDGIDAKARRGANIDSDHMLMVIKFKNSRATIYCYELEVELSGALEPEPLSLDDNWKRMEETVRKVATNTIGRTQKQAGKKWFYEEFRKMNEE
jgi:hypothetical protein